MSSSVAGRESARSLEEDEDAVKSEKTTASWFSSQRRTKDFKMQDAKPCGMSWGQAEERKRNFTGGVLRYVETLEKKAADASATAEKAAATAAKARALKREAD